MRHLKITLLAACLLPLSAVAGDHAHDEHKHEHKQETKHEQHEHASHEHGSLDAHEHGHARLNLALEGQTLELELESPAFNLIGFEHAPSTEAQKASVEKARQALSAPASLFGLPEAAQCTLDKQELESPLFAAEQHQGEHSEIHAHYHFTCANPKALDELELNLFSQFPQLEKLEVQAISEHGQHGATLSAQKPHLHLH